LEINGCLAIAMKKIEAPAEETFWLKDASNGDSQAFSHLLETYERPVFNLCYRMLGNSQDAEDAAQETFLRAYQGLKHFDMNRSFSTWLLSIAAHHCIDQLRKRRFQVISVEELPEADLSEPKPGIEKIFDQKQESKKIQKMLDALNPIDRAAVVMYYWYDYSYDEICAALSMSMSALKSRMHRARQTLLEEWESRASTDPDQKPDESKQSRKYLPVRMVL
jgi:RNA polymerase sigma-70 factor, ECF subfamily